MHLSTQPANGTREDETFYRKPQRLWRVGRECITILVPVGNEVIKVINPSHKRQNCL
jgi:hypothetical protein